MLTPSSQVAEELCLLRAWKNVSRRRRDKSAIFAILVGSKNLNGEILVRIFGLKLETAVAGE